MKSAPVQARSNDRGFTTRQLYSSSPDWSGAWRTRCGSSRRALYACRIDTMETAL